MRLHHRTHGVRTAPLLAVVALGAAALTACSTPDPGADPATSSPTAVDPAVATDLTRLEGGSWVLVSGTVDGEALVPVEGRDATLAIRRDGDLVTIGGTVCNSLGGELVGWPDAVEIGEIGSTAMLCEPEALMVLETAVAEALPRVTTITGGPDGVTLTGDGVELVYTARTGSDPSAITDITWTMQSLTRADGTVITPVEPSTVWVLGSDGTLQATSGCLTFTGSWRSDGYDVVFGDSRQDGQCEDAEMLAAGETLAALGDGFSASLEDGTLTTTSRFGVVATSIEATG